MDLTKQQNGKQRRQLGSPSISSMMYGKVPPQAKELEEAILGTIIQFKEAFDIAAEYVFADCFYLEAHQRVYKAMQSLQQKNSPIDLLTVVEELKFREELDLVGGPYYVSKLTNRVTSFANLEAYCKIVAQKSIQRELIRIGSEIVGDAYEDNIDVFEMLSEAEKKVMQIGTTHIHGGMMSMDVVLMNTLKKIDEWRNNDSTLTGVTSGFKDLDRATRGWQPGDLIIIAARPSVGKTAFALNLIRNAAINGKKTVAVWSLEMKSVYLALRMLAAESNIDLHKIQTGRLDDDQMWRLMEKGVNALSKANIFFDDSSGLNMKTLTAKARRLKKKNDLGMIVIDYLQLMSGEEKAGNREQEISKISRALKNLAKELDIPIIALSQLSREGVKGVTWEVGPQTSAMRESGAIEQDADVAIILWAASDSEINNNAELDGKRKIRIAKQRNGVVLTIELDFKSEIQLFEQINNTVPNNFRPIVKPYGYRDQEDAPF